MSGPPRDLDPRLVTCADCGEPYIQEWVSIGATVAITDDPADLDTVGNRGTVHFGTRHGPCVGKAVTR
ncbi:hypothetical protein B4N89_27660 [Embleya scabrispora]|uniref:Uncharacterized protein n=1 Tax=Embleya scabrispora TaxID=159449 RepID=A0A1T3P5C7_9ACTN|nr:hypothetical protein B4N89_27660 [Embleya scabrispora]